MLSHVDKLLGREELIENYLRLTADILDGMADWVRVIDNEGYTIYTNKSMEEDLGDNILGQKCYRVFGKNSQCRRCITEMTLSTNEVSEKEETIDDRIFSIKSSPVTDENDEVYAVVEVFRDVTKERKLEKEIMKRNENMSRDLSFARKIQKKILPKEGYYNGVDMEYYYKPCEMLSGDMFDVFNIDKHHVGFYVSDVVGHGFTASIMTMFIKQTMMNAAEDCLSPSETIRNLHRSFLDLNLEVESYFTILYGIIDSRDRTMKFVNGGHNSVPLVLKEDGNIEKLEANGYPITSLFAEVDHEEHTASLEFNDELLLYTDGIVEAQNKEKEEYGFERLLETIKNRDQSSIEAIKEDIEDFVYYDVEDDCTILKLKVL